MTFINPKIRKVNFSPLQELLASDINRMSALLHKIFKDFNTQVLEENESLTRWGCIIDGCGITYAGGYINVDSGVVLFNTGTGGDYDGTIAQVFGSSIPFTLPVSGTLTYYLDMAYTEVSPAIDTRHVFNPSNDIVINSSVATTTVPSVPLAIVTSSGPAPGSIRLANFVVNSSGLVSVTYETPKIWEMSAWPGTAHTFDSTQIKTLAQSLASIKAEIASILGASANWSDAPVATLQTLKSQLDYIQSVLDSIPGGYRTLIELKPSNNYLGTVTLPSNTYRIHVKLWGGGGGGGYTGNDPMGSNAGGRGGLGGYAEDVFNVSPGQSIPFSVGAGGSGGDAYNNGTAGGDTQLGPIGGITIFAGGGGGGTSHSDVTGAQGQPNNATIYVYGFVGGSGNHYRKLVHAYDIYSHFYGADGMYPGSGGDPGIQSWNGNAGADGLIQIFCE